MSPLAHAISGERTFDAILLSLQEKNSGVNERRIRSAYDIAVREYGDRMHWSGKTVLLHCVSVLNLFTEFAPDDDAVIACLLHHILDTHQWTLDDIERQFGPDVRTMISGEYLLSHVTTANRRMSMEKLRTIFLKVSDDMRLVLLLLCHQQEVLAHMDHLPHDERRRIARDTLQLFAPVAARLGIYSLKHELEGKSFPVAYPTDADRINEQIAQIHEKHGHFLEHVADELMTFLQNEGTSARITGREKQPYSIFLKMRNKTISHVEDLYDLFALRVIVKDVGTCYQTLGVLHRIGHPVTHRFKDYIAFPKPNGYQSLHTTLGRLPGMPEGIFIEVQLRTEEMQREADFGIAAHWSYKEGGTAEQAMRRSRFQRALLTQQPGSEDGTAHPLVDHIFVLTPKGDIVELPEGATTLDFAFHVHTALGLSFRAARVNGNIVPLTYQLENGDIVEIMRHPDPRPSPRWAQLLKTASARSRLKKFLVARERPAFLQLGKEVFNEELARHHLPRLDTDLTLLRLFDGKELSMEEREDMLVSLGQGARTIGTLMQHLTALKHLHPAEVPREDIFPPQAHATARVDGNIPMPVRFAKCCKPEEGKRETIEGVIGRTGDVRVHRTSCKMLKNVNRERLVGVRWVEKTKAR